MHPRLQLRQRFLSHALLPFVAIASVACGGTSKGNPTKPTQDDADIGPVIASASIGASGGSVKTPDGAVQVELPPGALGDTTEIAVHERATLGEGEVGVVYEIGPTGTRFSSPVTLTIAYSPDDLAGRPETDLSIATFAGGHWIPLADNHVDTKGHTVSGTTLHLSPYADVIVAPAADDGVPAVGGATGQGGAGGAATLDMGAAGLGASGGTTGGGDGTSSGGMTGSGGLISSGGTMSSGGINGAGGTLGTGGTAGAFGGGGAGGGVCMGDGGIGPPGGPYPRCATSNPCSYYPNLYVQDCVDTANGYMATCCPMNTGGGTGAGGTTSTGGTSGTSGAGGGSGGACMADGGIGPPGGPYPTCATSNPCSYYPNLYVQDCVDTANGYMATCCPTGSGGAPAGGGGTASGGAPSGGASSGGVPSGGASGGVGGGSAGQAGYPAP